MQSCFWLWNFEYRTRLPGGSSDSKTGLRFADLNQVKQFTSAFIIPCSLFDIILIDNLKGKVAIELQNFER